MFVCLLPSGSERGSGAQAFVAVNTDRDLYICHIQTDRQTDIDCVFVRVRVCVCVCVGDE